jgi:hypothetical protein
MILPALAYAGHNSGKWNKDERRWSDHDTMKVETKEFRQFLRQTQDGRWFSFSVPSCFLGARAFASESGSKIELLTVRTPALRCSPRFLALMFEVFELALPGVRRRAQINSLPQ